MMRQLRPTGINSYDFHKEIVRAKQEPRRGRLEAVDEVVAERIRDLNDEGPFDLPMSTLGHTCGYPICDPCLYSDLCHLWDVPTRPLEELKGALAAEFDATGIADCPYCGTDPVEGFDHYLPRDTYPEFAVTAINLFRACNRCNVLKGEIRPEGDERFLHPVLDPLGLPLVDCSIDPTHDPPRTRFGVDTTTGEHSGIGAQVRFHFVRLQLEDRFRKAAAPELGAFLQELEYRGLTRGLIAAETAESKARAHQNTWGPNRWSTVLYLALAEWLRAEADASPDER